MRYTVTIKDNKSGEILRELECNAIIGGASIDKETSALIGITDCSGGELIHACQSAKKAIYKVLENEPLGMVLFTLFEMQLMQEMKNKEQEKEDTDNA